MGPSAKTSTPTGTSFVHGCQWLANTDTLGAPFGIRLADGADLLFTGLSFQEPAANVAEYYDIPLATLHYIPRRGPTAAPALPAGAVGPHRNNGVRLAVLAHGEEGRGHAAP